MTSRPSKSLSEHANEIYEVMRYAYMDGMRLRVTKFGYLDLVDQDGNREPITSVALEDR